MTRRPALLLTLLFALTSCASEGGSRGSGISAAIAGNVADVQTAAASGQARARSTWFGALRALAPRPEVARAATALEGIHVSVEGGTAESDTDADGRFALTGDFEGLLSLVFERASDGVMARMTLNVPAAGRVTLNNVHIDPLREVAAAETQTADFECVITAVNCGGLTLTMRSVQQDANDLDRYTLHIDASSLQDAHGDPITCADLRSGQHAQIQQAIVSADLTFGEGTLQLAE